MKTKYIKVSVSDRIPEKEGDYFCVIANGPSIMTCRSMYFERFKGITHWLKEVPDYEDEMKEMLEFIYGYGEKVEWSKVRPKLEELLTKLKTESRKTWKHLDL